MEMLQAQNRDALGEQINLFDEKVQMLLLQKFAEGLVVSGQGVTTCLKKPLLLLYKARRKAVCNSDKK